MFKLGRSGGAGGGRGGGRRPLPPPQPPLQRGPARPPLGRGGARPPEAAPAGREEAFRLESRGPLDFAAIIRLTPDLVEEIRRAEARGDGARIKFDANSNNLDGNVINVGGKEFRFTWSRELGDLCDIYEERRNGEDGHGLLVECGSAWRKLNVQRILDESTKNHVKMRSEEAERQLKSRKAIVLDPANPSVKNQAKTMAAAAVEGSMRRMGWKQKKEPLYKKRKVEPNLVSNIGPPKSIGKSGTSSKSSTKGVPLVSPRRSPPEQLGAGPSALASGAGSSPQGDPAPEEIITPLNISKEGTGNFEKEMTRMEVHGAMHEEIGHKGGIGDKSTDLRTIIITTLSENPKGMSLKALVKVVAGKIPNSIKKIESILKNVANYQAPGRYFLKPGVEVESSKKRELESASSPEYVHEYTSISEPNFPEKATDEKLDQQTQLTSQVEEDWDLFEKIHGTQSSPDHFTGDRKVNNESKGKACSSSESGSDSESESDSSDSGSDSGSQSRSRSKSRSPAGSESGSSSDSESDGSSSCKEGSDVDVDIMTSDVEKADADHRKESAEVKLSSSPVILTSYDDEQEKTDISKRNQESHAVPAPQNVDEFEKDNEITHTFEMTEDFPVNNSIKASESPETGIDGSADLDLCGTSSRYPPMGMPHSADQHKPTENQGVSYLRSPLNDSNQQPVKGNSNEKRTTWSKHQQSDVKERISKAKPKRASEPDYFEEQLKTGKRSKAASSDQAMSFGKTKDAVVTDFSGVSPDIIKQDPYKDHVVQAANNVERSVLPISSSSGRKKAVGNLEKSNRFVEGLGRGSKLAEGSSVRSDMPEASAAKNMSIQERCSAPKDKLLKDMQNENGHSSQKYAAKNGKENFAGGRGLANPDSNNRKIGEPGAISKDVIQPSQIRKSDVENSPTVNGKRHVLTRELSDLELGEFREPPAGDEALGNRRHFERKGSFKLLENRVASTDSSDVDLNKGRNAANATHDLKKQSSPNPTGGILGNQDESWRRIPENDVDSTRPQQRILVSHNQPFLPARADTDDASHLDKTTETARRNERRTTEGMGLENRASAQKRPVSMPPHQDKRHDDQMGFKTVKDTKLQKTNVMKDSSDHRNGSLWMEDNGNGRKRRESSSDEDDSFYSKYDKDGPEIKGPIKDFLQYKEYVQEYREKYGHYCSLNKNLENVRNDFLKVGHELELAKGRDMDEYYIVLEQLKEMYHQHGAKHKQMKKVFILLHEELKNLKQKIKDFAMTYTKE